MGEVAYPEYGTVCGGKMFKMLGGGAKATGKAKAKVPSKQRFKQVGKVKVKAKSKRK